jgi:hypothetical protein
MATKFSTKIEKTNTKDFVFETLAITGSVVSGTYPGPSEQASNVKNATSGLYQTVFDYPHLSQSANQLFDVTFGIRDGGQFSTDESGSVALISGSQDKINIYNQMAAVMLGYDQTGSVRVFDVSGNFNSVNSSTVMDAPVFVNFSRLVGKDELKKGSFSLSFDTSLHQVIEMRTQDLVTVTDSGSVDLENGLRILKARNGGLNVGILDRFRGIAAIQLSSSVVQGFYSDLTPHAVKAGTGSVGHNYFVSASTADSDRRAYQFGESVASGTILELADAFRHRIFNLQVENTTQLNTVQYVVNAGAGDFNYSSNPSYVDASSQIRVKKTQSGALQKNLPAYAYVTGIGLYSPDGELLAVAKLSKPIKKSESAPLLLGVKLTY